MLGDDRADALDPLARPAFESRRVCQRSAFNIQSGMSSARLTTSVVMAIRLATSPAAWPPMPSTGGIMDVVHLFGRLGDISRLPDSRSTSAACGASFAT